MKLREYLMSQKSKLSKRAEELDKQEEELEKKNNECDKEDELREIGDSLEELKAEKAELEAELKEVEAQIEALENEKPKDEEKPNEDETKVDIEVKPERKAYLNYEVRTNGGRKIMNFEERKKRAEEFAKTSKTKLTTTEVRATLVSGGKIATPTEVSGIVDTFNRVSSIVDLVKVVNCEGMGANKIAYEVAIGTATTQVEGQAIGASDPTYDYVTITPQSIGILSQISKQVRKQSPLDYEGKIVDSAEKALRVNVAALITNAIVTSTLIDKPANLALSAIDATTLRKIAFNYGSDESIYGDAWLFLTKADLIAFGDVRGTNGNKSAVYEITPDTSNPNTGVIKDGGLSVRYCLNPNLTALANATANQVTMFYGQPECAELDLFSDYEVRVSEDFAFDKNMLTIRGDAEIGAGVIKQNGFVAVTKAE